MKIHPILWMILPQILSPAFNPILSSTFCWSLDPPGKNSIAKLRVSCHGRAIYGLLMLFEWDSCFRPMCKGLRISTQTGSKSTHLFGKMLKNAKAFKSHQNTWKLANTSDPFEMHRQHDFGLSPNDLTFSTKGSQICRQANDAQGQKEYESRLQGLFLEMFRVCLILDLQISRTPHDPTS